MPTLLNTMRSIVPIALSLGAMAHVALAHAANGPDGNPVADAGCTALRSGAYRLITPTFGGTPADQTSQAMFDAAALTMTRADGRRSRWEDKGNCQFIDPGVDGNRIEYVISQTGIFVGRITINGGSSFRIVVALPEQPHTLSNLAGVWDTLGLRNGGADFQPYAGRLSFDDNGAATTQLDCTNATTWTVDVCSVPAATPEARRYAEDPHGGFVSRTRSGVDRLFVYRVSNGQSMLVGIAGDGALFFGASPTRYSLPPVGRLSKSWNFDMTSRLASSTWAYTTVNVIWSVDPATDSWLRLKRSTTLSDEHPETLYANVPRSGYFSRQAGDARTAAGTVVHFNPFTALPLAGSGVIAEVLPSVKLFEIAVNQP